MTKWTDRYVELAELVATWSVDPSTKVGAVVVGLDRRHVALGYNGFPPGIKDDERLNDRPTKYVLMQHAERNVLDNAQFDLRGATLIVTKYPCHECAKSIVSKGVSKVIAPACPAGDRWAESAEWAKKIFGEARVVVEEV